MQELKGWLKIKYYLILGGFRFLSLLPFRISLFIAELITFIISYIVKYRRKVILQNLRNSFPNYTEKDIFRIMQKYYRHMSVMIIENIYLRFISKKTIDKRILVENKELFEELKAKNKHLILMLGHYGNWEYSAGLPSLIGYKGAAVYKKLSSKVFDKIYHEIRTSYFE